MPAGGKGLVSPLFRFVNRDLPLAEAQGNLGGAPAQAWLYPFLMNSRTESGVPAGVAGVAVVHKTGTIDQVENDAALVTAGPDGANGF